VNSIAPRASSVIVPPGISSDLTVLEFLSGRFPRIGLETWEKRIAEGKVRFGDGTVAAAFSKVGPGMDIRYFREITTEPRIWDTHRIVYRDEHILVACKPHFLPVVPGGRFVRECLLYHLMEETGLRGLSPVHRIDRHTAGLVLFSLHANERGRYQDLFRERQVEKRYLANVRWLSGSPAEDAWELEGRIEKDGPTL
jgi:tRNA pseudouridine32 synthase/23S rRNA pseudouridine746 synthase